MPFIFDDLQFSGWRSARVGEDWADTFILEISPLNGLPPAEYATGLYRLASALIRKRPDASLWVQVMNAPGQWYMNAMKSTLQRKGKLPIAVSYPSTLDRPASSDYHVFPRLSKTKPAEPQRVQRVDSPFSPQALASLQILGRIEHGTLMEVASLAGLDYLSGQSGLEELRRAGLVESENDDRKRGQGPVWNLKRQGLTFMLRMWGIPKEVHFSRRKERALSDPNGRHRLISRLWPFWLRTAWPHAQVWAGWSEVSIPGLSVTPDALAWGRLGRYETLFWLEVEDGHSSGDEIRKKIRRRFMQAAVYAKKEQVRLVFVLLGREWVLDAARGAFVDIPPGHTAVTLGDWRAVGQLPLTDWGRVEWK